MNREELQTSLESKLPFDCSGYRVTAMQALLLGEEIYYTDPALNKTAIRVLWQYENRGGTKLKSVTCSPKLHTAFFRFEDESMRSVYTKGSELPWGKLERDRIAYR